MTDLREPVLTVRTPSEPVRAAALVLHGGRAKSTSPVPAWSLAYLRMRPFAEVLSRAGAGHGLAVATLRHVVRGWNGDVRSPVADARWALDQLRERFGDVDVALIGHSMGGRTALTVADDPSVRTVIGLAPWVEPDDSVEPVTGRTLLIAHGTNDHMTSPLTSATFAERARGIAKQVTYVAVTGERHAMMRRAAFWHELSAAFTVETVLGASPNISLRADVSEVLTQALAGTPLVRI